MRHAAAPQLIAAAAALALTGLLPAAAPAEAPSAEQLAALAPALSHTDADLRKVDLGVTFDMPQHGVSFRVRLLVTGPDQAAVFIVDPADGTPIMATVNGQTLIYDPMSSSVMAVQTTRPSFDLLLSDGALRWNFGFSQHEPMGEAWKLRVDAGSFIAAAKAGRSVKPLDGGACEFTGATDKQARVVARLAPQRASPLVSLQYFPPDAQRPAVVLDQLLTNDDVTQTIRDLPAKDALGAEIGNVIELDWSHNASDAERNRRRNLVLERLFRALVFRNAIHDERLRPAAEMHFGNVDWIAYQKRDRANAEKLKRLIAIPADATPG